MPTLDASTNPEMANQIINSIISAPEQETTPAYYVDNVSETVITLPGGLFQPTGEVVTEAEVRELNGRDEEAISRTSSLSATIQMVIQRGTVRIGDKPVTEKELDYILAGDRDWILLNIYTATFGPDVEFTPFCFSCQKSVSSTRSLHDVVPVINLTESDPRVFDVKYSKGAAKVSYPNGKAQREMLAAAEKTGAELSTILLKNCIVELNGLPIMRDAQILDLSIRDRRTIAEAIFDKKVGPQLQDVKIPCPDCGTELEAPLTIAALFQFS
jgi:hypothetical protein